MTYACIQCGILWSDGVITEDISHGFCPRCLRPRIRESIRRKQVREGVHACYDTGVENCSFSDCAFKFSCQDSELDRWKETVI